MSINFGKAKKIAKAKSDDRRAIVQFHPGSGNFFAVLHDGSVLPIKEDYFKAREYYSRPINDAYDHWHKRPNGRTNAISAKTLRVITTYWATVKPKQKIVGIIDDRKFIVKY